MFEAPSESRPLEAKQFVGGAWVDGASSGRIAVENPANEAMIASIPEGAREDAEAALTAARGAWAAWAATPPVERGALVAALADALVARKEEAARLVTLEQGKPIDQARGEVDAAATFLRYAAENARRIEGDIVVSDNRDEEIQIRRHPYGVVIGLTAWNYPLALAARKLGPALVAGNVFVMLSHENTPLSGLFLAHLAESVGAPPGVFNVLTGRGAVVGQALVESPEADLVTMTGSTRAGKEIYRAGAETLKVLRLELGGKAPFIVMEDADLDLAVAAAVSARFANCGQICTCNERMYLHARIADEFLEKFSARAAALTIGDPMEAPDLGPKVSAAEVEKVEQMVRAAIQDGARVWLDRGPLKDGRFAKGHWCAPTVLEVADNGAAIMQSEVFGPVATAMRVGSFDQAVELANDTSYGLSAFVFTRDIGRLCRAPYALKFGEIYFNRGNGEQVQGFHTGWGMSGLGGEDGKYGFDGYLRKQSLYVRWPSERGR